MNSKLDSISIYTTDSGYEEKGKEVFLSSNR